MTARASRATILVVDDTPENVGLLLTEFDGRGHRVLVAVDGLDALAVVARVVPDVILLDVMMPRLDGYETCRRLKANPETRDIPVIFMTALSDTEATLRGFEVGGVDFVTKPFERAELRARVSTQLALARARETLATRGRQLERRNREIEALARMIAHELRNPLSTIAGGLESLDEALADGELSESRALVPWVLDVARQMERSLDALLTLADVAREERSLVRVDMRYLLQRALESLAAVIESRAALIEIRGALPDALGHGPWLLQVWTCLLDNALKYSGEPPELLVTAAPCDGGRVRYSVLDNGPGLTAEQRARAFEEFTRFHPRRARGSGLGLHLVRRIIKRLGGEATVAPRPAGGAAFSFTLARAPSGGDAVMNSG